MGQEVVNVEFRGHAQPTGAPTYAIWLHWGKSNVDELHTLAPDVWLTLCDCARAQDRPRLEGLLRTTVTPPGGWTPAWWEAAWRAALGTWDP